mgnify:CR=1 FL=1
MKTPAVRRILSTHTQYGSGPGERGQIQSLGGPLPPKPKDLAPLGRQYNIFCARDYAGASNAVDPPVLRAFLRLRSGRALPVIRKRDALDAQIPGFYDADFLIL